ncbi:hypothetical protein Q9189_004354 [Teloschistes chrysophthalmus]
MIEYAAQSKSPVKITTRFRLPNTLISSPVPVERHITFGETTRYLYTPSPTSEPSTPEPDETAASAFAQSMALLEERLSGKRVNSAPPPRLSNLSITALRMQPYLTSASPKSAHLSGRASAASSIPPLTSSTAINPSHLITTAAAAAPQQPWHHRVCSLTSASPNSAHLNDHTSATSPPPPRRSHCSEADSA